MNTYRITFYYVGNKFEKDVKAYTHIQALKLANVNPRFVLNIRKI